MTERETCGPTWTEALIFEPHAGFGGNTELEPFSGRATRRPPAKGGK